MILSTEGMHHVLSVDFVPIVIDLLINDLDESVVVVRLRLFKPVPAEFLDFLLHVLGVLHLDHQYFEQVLLSYTVRSEIVDDSFPVVPEGFEVRIPKPLDALQVRDGEMVAQAFSGLVAVATNLVDLSTRGQTVLGPVEFGLEVIHWILEFAPPIANDRQGIGKPPIQVLELMFAIG